MKKQIKELRQIFKTKKISNNSLNINFSDEEMNKIISLIQKTKVDGDYVVSGDLSLRFYKGSVSIINIF